MRDKDTIFLENIYHSILLEGWGDKSPERVEIKQGGKPYEQIETWFNVDGEPITGRSGFRWSSESDLIKLLRPKIIEKNNTKGTVWYDFNDKLVYSNPTETGISVVGDTGDIYISGECIAEIIEYYPYTTFPQKIKSIFRKFSGGETYQEELEKNEESKITFKERTVTTFKHFSAPKETNIAGVKHPRVLLLVKTTYEGSDRELITQNNEKGKPIYQKEFHGTEIYTTYYPNELRPRSLKRFTSDKKLEAFYLFHPDGSLKLAKTNYGSKIKKYDKNGNMIYHKAPIANANNDEADVFEEIYRYNKNRLKVYSKTKNNGKILTIQKWNDEGDLTYDKNTEKNYERKIEYGRKYRKSITNTVVQGTGDDAGEKIKVVEIWDRLRARFKYRLFEKEKEKTIEKYNEKGLPILKKIKTPEGTFIETKKYGKCGITEHIHFDGKKEIWEYEEEICKLKYHKYPDGKEENWEYKKYPNKEILLIYHKDIDGNEEIIKRNDVGMPTYLKHLDGKEEIWEYDIFGQLTYHKDEEGKEEIIKRSKITGKIIYHKHPDGREEIWDDEGNKINQEAIKKAEKYNKIYHGIFLHSLNISSLDNLLKIKKSKEYQEVCVSTVRSNTVFRSEHSNIVLVGFGKIRELYDFDAYSEVRDGKRYATKDIKQSEELHDINVDDNDINGYDEKLHYDEGFMNFENAEVIFASVPSLYDYSEKIRSQVYLGIIKKLEKLNPYIKIISPETFGKIKSSDELLRLVYKIKEKQDDERLINDPRFRFEEKKMFTFKKYMMLKESMVQIPLDNAYDIFKKEYEKATGKSWDKNKFMSRATNWEFYGDENGYVAIRRQKSGFVKLVGMAGNNKSKLKGMQDLISMNVPLWGMVSKEIKDIAVRKGMRMPNFLERQVLKRNISPEVFGDAKILDYMKDGGVKIQYPDVGVVVKYLVGTPSYYSELKKRFGDKIKNYLNERQ